MSTIRERLKGVPLVSEADPDFEKKASPEQLRAVERAARTAGKAADEKEVVVDPVLHAKYKIEVTFTHKRTTKGKNQVGIQVWESGKRFHGGGDQLMFVCTDTTEKDPQKAQGCGGFIYADNIHNGIAFCTHCKRSVVASKLGQLYYMNEPMQRIAERLTELFYKLEAKADILLKFHKSDIRYIAMERAKGPDVARRLKGMAIYPLRNIIKDTAHGADLTKRFKTFITS